MTLKKAYLNGKIAGKGMFSDEVIFKAQNYDGRIMSGFFEKNYISDGKLEVTIIKEHKGGNKVSICLPNYSFLGYGNLVLVNKKDLTSDFKK